MKEDGLKSNRCQGTGKITTAKLRPMLKQHMLRGSSFSSQNCNSSSNKSSLTSRRVWSEDLRIPRSAIYTKAFRSEISVTSKGEQCHTTKTPQTFPPFQTFALQLLTCSCGGEFETLLSRQVSALFDLSTVAQYVLCSLPQGSPEPGRLPVTPLSFKWKAKIKGSKVTSR